MVREDCKYLERKIVNGKETNTCRTDKNGVTVCFYCDNCTRYEKKGKKNWQVVQKKISEMDKDEFIDFISKLGKFNVQEIGNLCDAKKVCSEVDLCNSESWTCKDCVKKLLEKEYQPPKPKQEWWIVHRTLRTKDVETYVSIIGFENGFKKKYLGGYKEFSLYGYLYKPMARKFDKEDAIKIRDTLNEYRKGKQYLWVTSEVDE